MKTIKFFTVIVLMLMTSSITNAQACRTRLQHKRIAHGIRNGELTFHETRQLTRQQRNIRLIKREARADGFVSPSERRIIRQETRRANRNIARKKNNRRDRNWMRLA